MAATTVSGEDLKLHQMSLSVTRCSQPGERRATVASSQCPATRAAPPWLRRRGSTTK